MTCHPASTYARYLEGDLPPEERRSVEAHLVHCRRCRELVLLLRDRVDPADAEPRETRPPADPEQPAPSLGRRARALALPITLLALAAAVATATALIEAGVAGSGGASEPLGARWRGVTAMAIDLVFVLRESAPVLFELALPVAVMASASALLSFGLSTLRRRIGGPGAKALAALAIAAAPGPSDAHFGLHEHEELVVEAGTEHPGTLVASARSVTVDGAVDGDLVVLTERLVLRGEVVGNLFAVAREAELRGVVHGSLFLAGERIDLAGEVRGDAYAAGDEFVLSPRGRIARDATLVAERARLEGELGRDANAIFARRLEVRGAIGRDLRGRADRLLLLGDSEIGRDVDAALPEGVEIERRPGSRVGGELRASVREPERRSDLGRLLEPELYAWMLLHVGAGFVLGMVAHLLAPGLLAVRADTPRDLLRGFGIGLAALVAAPVALALVAATVVGIPLALIGAAALATALGLGLVAVAARLGSALLHLRDGSRRGFGAALALGLALLVVLTHLPFLGGALRVVATLVGLGLLLERAREAWRGRAKPAAG